MVEIPTKTFLNLNQEKQDRIIKASLIEFSERSFEEARLSNIIKASDIPRGSLYQYFKDKRDLYFYLFKIIQDNKIEFLKDDLLNIDGLPFLELFRILYKQGIKFANAHPEYIGIGKHLFNSRGQIYDELAGDGLKLARDYYIGYIESDKQKGIIRADVDSETLADLVLTLTTNVATKEFSKDNFNLDSFLVKIDNLINIFKKGIE